VNDLASPIRNLLIITPPLTQLNTPYPAASFLKGFLQARGYLVRTIDLGIALVHAMMTRNQLTQVFDHATQFAASGNISSRSLAMLKRREQYLLQVDPVMAYLSGQDPTFAYRIEAGQTLPYGHRLSQMQGSDSFFGDMGTRDRALYLCSLFVEELCDLIHDVVDPHFSLSRYAESVALDSPDFDAILEVINAPATQVGEQYLGKLSQAMNLETECVCLSVPFPGNVVAAFQCAQWLRDNYPKVIIILGGAWVNTELRSLSDARVFDLVDYICFDDGFRPLELILQQGKRSHELAAPQFKRTMVRNRAGQVELIDNDPQPDYLPGETGNPSPPEATADFAWLQILDFANPMHRLWSDGRWNKLMLAHGCYWAKCSFCDTSLDYIKRYVPAPIDRIIDQIKHMIVGSGQRGFHFVDEAAPPALLKELSLRLLREQLVITWWTNIRYDKAFSPDLCRLMAAAGCIAVSGGLEVANDRLLKLINKGITIDTACQVLHNFTSASIMTHAYLMYDFPGQTLQETIDSLEIVRQCFHNRLLFSGFWHALTVSTHAPLGKHPGEYGITLLEAKPVKSRDFAKNTLKHKNIDGHLPLFIGEGLRKALYNYMHGNGMDMELSTWFTKAIPLPTIGKSRIKKLLDNHRRADVQRPMVSEKSQLLWIGTSISIEQGTTWQIRIHGDIEEQIILVETQAQAESVLALCTAVSHGNMQSASNYSELLTSGIFQLKAWVDLCAAGLLVF